MNLAQDAEVVVVISNVDGAYALERARKKSIPTEVVPHGDYQTNAYDRELVRYSAPPGRPAVLAGFMRVHPGFLEFPVS